MRAMIASLVDEGRTVMLSSHLLDEVERTCNAVAIVDRGRVIRQGPIVTPILAAHAIPYFLDGQRLVVGIAMDQLRPAGLAGGGAAGRAGCCSAAAGRWRYRRCPPGR